MFLKHYQPATQNRSLFEDLDDFLGLNRISQVSQKIAPLAVQSDATHVYVDVELPGIDKKEIQIEYHDGILSVSGEKKSKEERKEDGYFYSEFRSGTFKRQVNIGKEVDFDKATAVYEDGLLKLTLPKSKVDTPKTLSLA